jgi:nucleotide-binding universal stress UspA family protein
MIFRHVLCAVDFSRESRAALRAAASIVRTSRGRLTVLFVNDPLLVSAGAAAHDTRASQPSSLATLQRFVARVLSASIPVAVTRVAAGDACDQILKRARRDHADLVVIGTRGRGRIDRLLLGSTAEGVLRRTRIPVLAVPLP